jgi:hypothetical protein
MYTHVSKCKNSTIKFKNRDWFKKSVRLNSTNALLFRQQKSGDVRLFLLMQI